MSRRDADKSPEMRNVLSDRFDDRACSRLRDLSHVDSTVVDVAIVQNEANLSFGGAVCSATLNYDEVLVFNEFALPTARVNFYGDAEGERMCEHMSS